MTTTDAVSNEPHDVNVSLTGTDDTTGSSNDEQEQQQQHGDFADIIDTYSYDDITCLEKIPNRTICHMFAMNAFAFAYGALLASFGLITLPVESEKLWPEKHALLLSIFLGLTGVSQLSGPGAGFFSDRSTSKMGKRRPFLLYSSFVCIPSLFIMRWASIESNLPAYMACFFLAMLALNVMYVAYSGALNDLVNEHQRGIANGIMGAFGVLGASTGFAFYSTFLTVESGYIFYIAILSVSVLVSLLAWVDRSPVCTVVDVKQDTATTPSSSKWTWRELCGAYWIDPVVHKNFFLVFVSRTFYYMGTSLQAFMLFYFRDVIDSDDPQADVSFLALFAQLTAAIVCLPMGILSNNTGRKPLIYLSSAILIGTYFLFMFCSTRQMAFLAGAIYGLGNGTYLSVDYSLACDTIPSKEQSARFLGIWGVGSFIGSLFGPMFMGPSLSHFGRTIQGEITYDVRGYQVILLIGSACFFIGAVLICPVQNGSKSNKKQSTEKNESL